MVTYLTVTRRDVIELQHHESPPRPEGAEHHEHRTARRGRGLRSRHPEPARSRGARRVLSALTNWITRTIADHGLIAVFGLMLLESACIPVPSEVIMLYAGYLVSIGKLGLVAAVTAGVLGNLAGSIIAWWAGSAGGRGLILRHGRYIHVTDARLALADRWFERYGERTVMVARCVPIVRPSSPCPPGSRRCRWAASRSTPRSGAFPGCWR